MEMGFKPEPECFKECLTTKKTIKTTYVCIISEKPINKSVPIHALHESNGCLIGLAL